MKVNTVVISLDRLKELELVEKKVNKPRSKTIVIEGGWGYNFTVETDDECAEKLAKKIKTQQEEIKKLEDEIKKLEDEIEKLKNKEVEITIDDVKKMNYWGFRKWKKS